eukprot:NODE_4190_length_829_cov_23.174359_g3464_i0.p1 GENE.NODE_4190_length_829_cov_23.174359_g3464_i0~~NODE_4190_length_829_cov_23.174359_g3464_i0.p1  ORF type:complete len:206 (-),score=8.94 NODE_4190_length_829_cov_23.174359_g3464_i0:109-726(-)
MAINPIWFYLPNLIGYVRIISTAIAFAVAFHHPWWFLVFYTVGFLLDAADGWAARKFRQCTKFGAVLDMVTDRVATNGFLLILSHLEAFNGYTGIMCLLSLNALDFGSHWIQMYSSQGGTHKGGINPLLRWYYSNRIALGVLCMGQEFFYLFLYAYNFFPKDNTTWMSILYAGFAVTTPIFALKQIINIIQLCEASSKIVQSESA